jgi:methylase of polypeptide subunit release factors
MTVNKPDADDALVALGLYLKRAGYRFTTVSPATHFRVNARKGNERAVDLQGIFGWSRPFELSDVANDVHEFMQHANVIVQDGDRYRSLVRASTIGDALFFHSAYPTQEQNAVFFGPDTYRFVAAIDQHVAHCSAPVHRAVDIGCGCGPGAISIARALPLADVLAVDINPMAVRFTRVNARLAGTDKVRSQLSNLLHNVEGAFDLIVANPPYLVDPDRRAYRHGAGELGEGLSVAIVDSALQRLQFGGSLLLYTGVAIVHGIDPFLAAVERKFQDLPIRWTYREIDPDIFGEELDGGAYADVDRIAAVLLVVHK